MLTERQVCDLSPGPIIVTYSQSQEIDFLHSWTIEPVVLLMPAPVVVTGSISALWNHLKLMFVFIIKNKYYLKLVLCMIS